jgi:diguanylate cyclase (GGDEF)-like protein
MSSRSASTHGAPRLWRVRTLLLGLVLASLLPGLLVAGFLLAFEYRRGLEQQEANVIAVARTLVQAADSRLHNARLLGQALATTAAMREQDFAALHRRARQLLPLTGAGRIVVVSDASGQQLLNTLVEFGRPLPRHGSPAVLRRVFDTGTPVISDVYIGGVLGKPVLSVDVPVWLDGRLAYDLSVGIATEDLNAVLRAAGLPPNWVVALFDSSGTIAARSHAPEQFVGEKGTLEFIERIRQAGEGVMATTTREGIEVVSGFSRSDATGWSVGIGIPRQELHAGLKGTYSRLALGFSLLFGVGVGLAWIVASSIAGSMRALIATAAALGSGEPRPVPPIAIRESAEVAHAIAEAAELLRGRAQALEEANAALRAHEAELAAAGQRLESEVAERTAELTAANRALERIAREDPLTGARNRLAAGERLREEFVRMKRTGQPYAVLLMDVDHFKRINDTFGHGAGDEVLRQLAHMLASSFRESDFLARFGGEEFLAILPATDLPGASASAEKIRAEMSARAIGAAGRVTISIGVALARPTDASEEEAVRRADAALYRAKRAGRNAVVTEP